MTNEEKQPENTENEINEQQPEAETPEAAAEVVEAEVVETDIEAPAEAVAVQQVADDEIEAVAGSVPPPDTYPEGQAEAMAKSLPEDANTFEKSVTEAVEVTEQAQSSPAVQGFGSAVAVIQRAIESVGGERTTEHHDPATHGDKTYFLGKEYDIPIYTSVFMALGVLTVIEVLLAELISGDIKIPLLLGIAGAKALLVVIFYMHLNTDSRIFSIVLAVPVGLAILSVLFLVAIPTGY